MLLKYTVYTVAALAILAEVSEARRRRKGGKRGKGKAAKPAAPAEDDPVFSDAMTGPGAEEIFASLSEDPFENLEDFLAEFGDDDGFRGVGGFGEQGFRAVTLQQIMNAGGPEYCRDMSKIRPSNRPSAGQPGYSTWKQMMDACGELNSVMDKRKAACHNFLMKVVYNPNREYELKPMEKTRQKYCHDITKLRNPWLFCERNCPKGRKGRFCQKKKNQCKNNLKVWQDNNEKLKTSDDCRKLPQGMKVPPPPNHPANNKRKCTKTQTKKAVWTCVEIPGSHLPWCPYGYSEKTKEQHKGKGSAAAWGKGKKKRKPKRKNTGAHMSNYRGIQDPTNNEKMQAMIADMENIESQFGHAALNKEIERFQKKKKNKKGRTSYEEAVALSYTDDDVMDK